MKRRTTIEQRRAMTEIQLAAETAAKRVAYGVRQHKVDLRLDFDERGNVKYYVTIYFKVSKGNWIEYLSAPSGAYSINRIGDIEIFPAR